MNRIEQPKPVIIGVEVFEPIFFNDRLQICFKIVRTLKKYMERREKILIVALITAILTASGAAQQNKNSSSVDPGLIPGDFFYPVESFVENLEVSIAGLVGGENFKAKAIANNAQEKLAEAEILAERNKSEKAAEMTEKYTEEINRSRGIAEKNSNRNLSGQIDDISRKNVDKLEEVRKKVPEETREKIREAINKSKEKAEMQKPQEGLGKNPEKDKTQNSTRKKPELPENNQTEKKKELPERNKAENLSKRGEKNIEDTGNVLNKSMNSSEPNIDSQSSSKTSQQENDSGRPSHGSSTGGDENEGGSENPLEKGGKGLL